MIVFKAQSFGEAYRDSLAYVIQNGPENGARGTKSKEILDVALVVENPALCLYQNQIRSSQFKYIAAEFLWYYMGRNDAKFITKWAKFWNTIKNDDGTCNSAYGNLIFKMKNEHGISQYQWAIQSLIKDSNTRQAVMHFNMPIHQHNGNKDFVCTMYVNVHIRNNKLNLKLNIRSNDALWGTPTDAAFFCSLQMQILNHLKPTYPDLELGTYTHVADSYHVYDRHYDLTEKMLQHDFVPCELPAITNDLIDSTGEPMPDLITLFNSVDTGNPEFLLFQDGDDIYKWIHTNITKTK